MYSWRKGIARWDVGDTLYLSVPFTWLMDEAQNIANEWKGKVRIGGPGVMEPTECEEFEPLLFHNPCATFTTRGCPNVCPFCAVPRLEGDLVEIKDFRPAPVVCDNNLLAASLRHIRLVVDRVKIFPFVDFNQGLEAKRFTPEMADLLGQLKCKVRFALDYWGQEGIVKDAIGLCRHRTTKNIGIYCLIGYKDDPESARERLELVRSWGIRPNPMRYQPLDTKKKNSYLASSWTEREMRKMVEYYSRLRWYEHIPYDEFRTTNQMEMELNISGDV